MHKDPYAQRGPEVDLHGLTAHTTSHRQIDRSRSTDVTLVTGHGLRATNHKDRRAKQIVDIHTQVHKNGVTKSKNVTECRMGEWWWCEYPKNGAPSRVWRE